MKFEPNHRTKFLYSGAHNCSERALIYLNDDQLWNEPFNKYQRHRRGGEIEQRAGREFSAEYIIL